MTLCPICNEQLEDPGECNHCKTDLRQIMDTKTEAIYHHEKGVAAFEQNRFHEMFFHARRSVTLFYTPDAAKLLACAALMVSRFDLGYVMWKNLTHNQTV